MMMDDDDEDEDDDNMGNFPPEGEEIDWNTRCEKCQFFGPSVHVQDQTWKGYCGFDNNIFAPVRVYNTSHKCSIGEAIDLSKDPSDATLTVCNKCGQSTKEFHLVMTRYKKG